jgi:hypothetical protein
LRVTGNRTLRRMLNGLKGKKVTRNSHSEELHNSNFSSDIAMIISRRMRWVEYVARIAQKKDACNIFVGKPEGKLFLEDLG